MRRVVFEATIGRRVVAWGDDQAVGNRWVTGPLASVVIDDGHRDRRRRHIATLGIDHGNHVVASQHLKRGQLGRARKSVGVLTNINRATDALALPIFDNRLGDRRDVIFVEAAVECGASVT